MDGFKTKYSGGKSSPIGSPGGAVANQNMKARLKSVKIGTWNARSLFASGKLDNVMKEMSRLSINILGISDVRWPGSGKCRTNNGVFYYSGIDDPNHRYGVGVIIDKATNASVQSFTPYSERVMMLQIKTCTGHLNIIQIYAPTADSEEVEVKEFYAELETIIASTKKSDVTIVMGDFNAKVGKDKVEAQTGGFGLGERNERGERLIQFCQEKDLMVANTYFKLPYRRLYTWKSPADNPENIIRNQIDYILINNRYRNAVTSTKTYPGADINSDHNPVVAKLHIKMKKITKRPRNYIDARLLKNPKICDIVKYEVNKAMREFNVSQVDNVEGKWDEVQVTLREIATSHLVDKEPQRKKKAWMTSEILDLMEERRKSKGKEKEYRELQKRIQKRIREAKEEYLTLQCEEIEVLEKNFDSFHVHKKVKEMAGCHFEKAFDKVRHGVMYRLLDNKGIDAGDIRIISNLYWGQKAAARIENQLTEEIEIRRGQQRLVPSGSE
ncbi:craniofacial development protein 2-like [Nilaparvata lugens]|uniref:craniofacial development protein 2-like n=1 Tax=Nilaparvata lugens TaxID=108931 RepID=UPI00193D0637|nr:craniofacial development protein 2-like [Nilaparvata lugens]